MKTNQNQTITLNFSSIGYKCEIIPLFFAKFQAGFGVDIKPLFIQWFRSEIEKLSQAQELGVLTKSGQFDLEDYKTAEQILTSIK